MSMECASCKSTIHNDESGFLDRCVRITRGDFRFNVARDGAMEHVPEDDNVKYERFICQKCFLEDPDLCAFFNRIGDRVR